MGLPASLAALALWRSVTKLQLGDAHGICRIPAYARSLALLGTRLRRVIRLIAEIRRSQKTEELTDCHTRTAFIHELTLMVFGGGG